MMGGVPKQTINAIHATAYQLEELEELTILETIKEAFDSQITEFTLDMKLLVEDANEKIDSHIKATMDQAAKALAMMQPLNQNEVQLNHPSPPNGITFTISSD